MSEKILTRGSIAALLLAIPLFAGCPDPPLEGPGGGPSSGTTGSTNAPGTGRGPSGSESVSGH